MCTRKLIAALDTANQEGIEDTARPYRGHHDAIELHLGWNYAVESRPSEMLRVVNEYSANELQAVSCGQVHSPNSYTLGKPVHCSKSGNLIAWKGAVSELGDVLESGREAACNKGITQRLDEAQLVVHANNARLVTL